MILSDQVKLNDVIRTLGCSGQSSGAKMFHYRSGRLGERPGKIRSPFFSIRSPSTFFFLTEVISYSQDLIIHDDKLTPLITRHCFSISGN